LHIHHITRIYKQTNLEAKYTHN